MKEIHYQLVIAKKIMALELSKIPSILDRKHRQHIDKSMRFKLVMLKWSSKEKSLPIIYTFRLKNVKGSVVYRFPSRI